MHFGDKRSVEGGILCLDLYGIGCRREQVLFQLYYVEKEQCLYCDSVRHRGHAVIREGSEDLLQAETTCECCTCPRT